MRPGVMNTMLIHDLLRSLVPLQVYELTRLCNCIYELDNDYEGSLSMEILPETTSSCPINNSHEHHG